jgi:hypothetical protein
VAEQIGELAFELTVTTIRYVAPEDGPQRETVRALHVAITEAEFLELRNAILARWGNHV